MAGKSPYATPEERRAAKRAAERRRYHAFKADPEWHAKRKAAQREALAEAAARRAEAAQADRMPKTLDVQLYRSHGPWAPLFALQA